MEDYERTHLIECMYTLEDDESDYMYWRAREVSGYERVKNRLMLNNAKNWINRAKQRNTKKSK